MEINNNFVEYKLIEKYYFLPSEKDSTFYLKKKIDAGKVL